MLAGVIAAIGVVIVYRLIRRYAIERAERGFRLGQIASSSMVALAHGTNDAQKTMGIISLALIANGSIAGGDDFEVPVWVIVSCATALALGTYCGGWRIMKTLGTKVVEVRPPQGFGSEAVAATVILASSHVGYPLSTTQVVSGAVTGSGVGRPGAQVNWLVARNIVAGWVLTLPAAAATAAVCYAVIELLGGGAFGVLVVGGLLAVGCLLLWRANRRQHVAPEESVSAHPTFGPATRAVTGGDMSVFATVVDWEPLWQAALASFAFGLGILITAALGVSATLRVTGREPRRPRRRGHRVPRGCRAARRVDASPPWSTGSG